MGDAVHIEVAWEIDPLTRPDPGDWVRLGSVDPDLCVGSVSTSRGVNIRTGEITTGTASARVWDPNGNLDPSNALSEWSPNVGPRRRVRFVVDAEAELLTWDGEPLTWDGEPLVWGGEESVLWTGFLNRLPIRWRQEIQWTDLTASGICWLLADVSLPPSVLHHTIAALGPVAHWPLIETDGRIVEDVAGDYDGTLVQVATNGETIVPYDDRPVSKFYIPWNDSVTGSADPLGQRVTVSKVPPVAYEQTVSLWIRRGSPVGIMKPVWIVGANSVPVDTLGTEWLSIAVANAAQGFTVEVSANDTSDNGSAYYYGVLTDDAKVHHVAVAFSIDPVHHADAVWVYVDGEAATLDADASDLAGVDLAAVLDAVRYAHIGYGLTPATSGEEQAAFVGHVAWYDRILTADEVASIYEAGVNAWSGDLTGARLNRILDIAGVDEDDRDIDAGTQTCGPTRLNGENVMEYVRQIAATEGAPVGEDAEGRIFLRPRTANAPTAVATFSDDPDEGTPVAPLDPDYSLDRVVNTAFVTRENGQTQQSSFPASVTQYGPKTIKLETLHQSPSGSRAAASRLTIRNQEPRLVFPTVVADRIETPADVLTGSDIGDAVDVIARPPRGGDPIEQLSIVESVNHGFAVGESWKTTFGVVEHTVLPDFWWDEPGQGWDESVWAS